MGLARIERLGGERPTGVDGFAFAGEEERGGGVEQHGVAFGPAFLPTQQAADDFGVRLRVATGEVGQRGGLQREVSRIKCRGGQRAVVIKLGHETLAQCGKFIEVRVRPIRRRGGPGVGQLPVRDAPAHHHSAPDTERL